MRPRPSKDWRPRYGKHHDFGQSDALLVCRRQPRLQPDGPVELQSAGRQLRLLILGDPLPQGGGLRHGKRHLYRQPVEQSRGARLEASARRRPSAGRRHPPQRRAPRRRLSRRRAVGAGVDQREGHGVGQGRRPDRPRDQHQGLLRLSVELLPPLRWRPVFRSVVFRRSGRGRQRRPGDRPSLAAGNGHHRRRHHQRPARPGRKKPTGGPPSTAVSCSTAAPAAT